MHNSVTGKIGAAMALCLVVACATGGRKMTVWEIYDVRHPVRYQGQVQPNDNDTSYTPPEVGYCSPIDIASFSCE